MGPGHFTHNAHLHMHRAHFNPITGGLSESWGNTSGHIGRKFARMEDPNSTMLYAMLYHERHTCRSRAQRMLHISPHFGSVPETATTKRAASLPLASRVGDMPTSVLSLQTFPVTHSLLKGLVSWYHTGGKHIIILLLTSVSTFSSQQEVVPGFVRLGQCERADAGLVRGGLLHTHTHTQPQGNKPQETKPNKSKKRTT